MLRLVVFLLFLAAVLYAFFWLIDQRGQRARGKGRGTGGDAGGKGVPRGPLGPDDDDDFLRELDWEHRKRQQHEGDA